MEDTNNDSALLQDAISELAAPLIQELCTTNLATLLGENSHLDHVDASSFAAALEDHMRDNSVHAGEELMRRVVAEVVRLTPAHKWEVWTAAFEVAQRA